VRDTAETGGAGKGPAHAHFTVPRIGARRDEVTTRAESMPADADVGSFGRLIGSGGKASVVVAAPTVGTLAADVGAVDPGTTGLSCPMRRCVAHRTPPFADDVGVARGQGSGGG
jgi:hypothetical protein